MTSDVMTPDLLRDTIRYRAQDASAVKVYGLAWLEFEKPDLDRDEVDQAAGNAFVDAFTVPWKSEVRP
ncbi:hypothetical protein ACFPJ1_09805 [Kribbella qitaiheensis]|uniref:hypothetical protein n=1 Tax=Kribbella qitaiheensis TaxID=1544730 RepID=UPI00361CA72D